MVSTRFAGNLVYWQAQMPELAFTVRPKEVDATPRQWQTTQSRQTIQQVWGRKDAQAYRHLDTWLQENTSPNITVVVRTRVTRKGQDSSPFRYTDDIVVQNTHTGKHQLITRTWIPSGPAPKFNILHFFEALKITAKILDSEAGPAIGEGKRPVVDVPLEK